MSAWTTHPSARIRATAKRLQSRELLPEAMAIARRHSVTFDDIAGRSRAKRTVKARHEVWAWLYGLGFSYPECGYLWGVDASTVLAALRKVPRRCTQARPGRCYAAAAINNRGRGFDVCLRPADREAIRHGW
jgi:hypothetical protein